VVKPATSLVIAARRLPAAVLVVALSVTNAARLAILLATVRLPAAVAVADTEVGTAVVAKVAMEAVMVVAALALKIVTLVEDTGIWPETVPRARGRSVTIVVSQAT